MVWGRWRFILGGWWSVDTFYGWMEVYFGWVGMGRHFIGMGGGEWGWSFVLV